ncbi:tautomerase family protein [Pararhizobium sp. LjRoot238]|uniref:tautomerase family protein n=1 Tax=Pararhizobium sp. LjRoot238 TaxID=3342293 RepID=UPI003ECCAC0F
MPLLKFHLYKGRSPEEIGLLLDAAHEAMVLSFGVPTGDRYQVVSEYDEPHRVFRRPFGISCAAVAGSSSMV